MPRFKKMKSAIMYYSLSILVAISLVFILSIQAKVKTEPCGLLGGAASTTGRTLCPVLGQPVAHPLSSSIAIDIIVLYFISSMGILLYDVKSV